MMNRQKYLASLPRKIMGAGCLLFDEGDNILIVKPIYKDYWTLPGGVVEQNESPRDACIREVKEEIGINIEPERLLCIDYTSIEQKDIESLQFIFLGGVLSSEMISTIKIATDEISEYRFLPPQPALSLMSTILSRRVAKCLTIKNSDRLFYLEDQEAK